MINRHMFPKTLILDGSDITRGCTGVVVELDVENVPTVKITLLVTSVEVSPLGVITLKTEE